MATKQEIPRKVNGVKSSLRIETVRMLNEMEEIARNLPKQNIDVKN